MRITKSFAAHHSLACSRDRAARGGRGGLGGWLVAACALGATLPSVGCERASNVYVPPPPPEVTVAQPTVEQMQDSWEFTGVTAAIEAVDLRPRVQGFIQEVHFLPDSRVQPGDPLFTIDPRPYQARVEQAEADLAAREAESELAEVVLERTQEIIARSAGSELELRERIAQRNRARANVALAEAVLAAARLELSWCTVEAPFAGHLGRNLVDRGAFVDTATVLASIVNDERIFVYFEADEGQHLEYMSMFPDARTRDGRERNPGLRLRMQLANEEGYPHEGRVDWADNAVDTGTGTIRVRGVFENPERRIIPGLFARLRLAKGGPVEGLLVPQTAVGQDQAGRFVLVVDDENRVQRRGVRLGAEQRPHVQVVEGLGATDWIVVNGLQRARPDTVVTPLKADAGAAGAVPAEAH